MEVVALAAVVAEVVVEMAPAVVAAAAAALAVPVMATKLAAGEATAPRTTISASDSIIICARWEGLQAHRKR